MKQELIQISNVQKQISSTLQQRGFSGTESPQEIISSAKEILKQKIENQDETITTQDFNRAQRVLRSIGRFQFEVDLLRSQIASEFQNKFPFIPSISEPAAASACYLVESCRLSISESEILAITQAIESSLKSSGAINLFSFTCPEVDYNLLTDGGDPNDFILTTARQNTLSQNWQRNRQLFSQLSAVSGGPVKLTCIVGELDEESYIFPILGNFNTDSSTLIQKRIQYRTALQNQIQKTYPLLQTEVVGWSQLNPDTQLNFDQLPSLDRIDEELKIMSDLMQPGNYYNGILKPSTADLRQICELKMKTYAIQGLVIQDRFPNSIGLQNEYPQRLRTFMLNAGIIALNQEPIPFIYPYNLKP